MTYIDKNKIEKARKFAYKYHGLVNQLYDGKPYADTHLQKVYDIGLKYIHLIPKEVQTDVLIACWLHDLLEDVHFFTYNDVKKLFGEVTAEIVFACTNDKGRTRKDRAGNKYYKGIRNTKYATFVKLCDRLANMSYSKSVQSSMFKTYKREHPYFVNSIKGTTNLIGKLRYWLKTKLNKFEANYEVLYFELEKLSRIDMNEFKIKYQDL